MICIPHNDHVCLGAITREVAARVDDRDPALLALAQKHADTAALAAWIRTLPQRDDEGLPDDGPKVAACRPVQRLRIPAADPNCVERAAIYLGAAELIDPVPVRRLATVHTPQGLHTLPSEDGEPVVLDPRQTRNALRAALDDARNAAPASQGRTARHTVDWIAELATTPAERVVGGIRRVRNGYRALRGLLLGQPLCLADVHDVAFMLALAERAAAAYGPAGPRIVQTTARAVDRLDQVAAEQWLRNASELRIGGYSIAPKQLLGALARIGGRVGGKVGLEALKIKLASVGVGPPVINAIEKELQHEGMTLGPLATPPAMLGSLASLTPQALAGRWLASKL